MEQLSETEEKDYQYLLKKYSSHIANTFKHQVLSLRKQKLKQEKNKKKRKTRKAGVLPKEKIQEVAKILTSFWKSFNLVEGKEDRLEVLKYHANIEVYKFAGKGLSNRREDFLKDSTLKLKQNSKCICCGSKASERHHVIQLQYGGSNAQRNVVPICKSCHSEIHPWLAE